MGTGRVEKPQVQHYRACSTTAVVLLSQGSLVEVGLRLSSDLLFYTA